MVNASRRSVLGIRWIVACAAAVLTTLVVLGVTGVMQRRTRSVLGAEIESRLLLEARNLALASTSALLSDYPELLLAPLVKEKLARQPEVALIAVLDRSGTIQGHPDVRRIGTAFAPPDNLGPVTSSVSRGPHESLLGNATILLASAPVLDADGRVLGSAVVAMRRSHIEQTIDRIGRQQYLILGAFLLAGGAASFVLMSILLRPIRTLREGIDRIGRGDLDTPVKLADQTEFGLLADAVNEMSSALKAAQGEMVERARLAHEMELARQIQRSLLPSKPTAAGEFIIEGEQWAATEVGGDYYDVLTLPGGKIALTIADVSGKGLAGCLVTSMLFSLLRASHTAHSSPAALLAALDERLAEILQPGNFVTMFYGVLDPDSGRLVYSSAGHSPTLVYRAEQGRAEWFRSEGIPLGSIRGGAVRRTLNDSELVLGPGDVLVQFTDGITEAMTPSTQEQFGFERMESVIVDGASVETRDILDRLHRAVEGWRRGGVPDDDETVLVVRRERVASRERVIGGTNGPDDASVAATMRRLAEAEARGVGLRLTADLGALSRIGEWLASAGIVRGTTDQAAGLLNLALYEACANIVEHGYDEDSTHTLELWWVAGSDSRLTGSFLIRDYGKPFHPGGWKEADFRDPDARRRGRGLGLKIIQRVMGKVTYHPETDVGNITVMAWDPVKVQPPEKEHRHA